MVQEFHVLRCFSCQTFQVQQVKKSKKWSCKMCGEKQSLMKEYGRGTGAECRRHVQKLNSLRGELLEVENERAWTQWEEEEEEEEEQEQECEIGVKVELGDKNESWVQKGHEQGVSRWNKYVERKEDGPGCEEDEQEEAECVYTDKELYRQRNKISKKRKKSFNSGDACGRYHVGVDDVEAAHWGDAGPSQGRRHHGALKPQERRALYTFPCASTNQGTVAYDSPAASLGSTHLSVVYSQSTDVNKHSSAEISARLQPSVPFSDVSAASSSRCQHGETRKRLEAKDSKWARFLSSVCVEDDKDEEKDGGSGECYDVDPTVKPVPTAQGKDTGCLSGKVFNEGKKESVFEKLSQCVNGDVWKQPNIPTITPINIPSQKPVCVQPLPIKRPCPASSFSTLFQTDEDFDDSY